MTTNTHSRAKTSITSQDKNGRKEPFISWLAFGYGNITFEDSLDFDISEIESIYEHQEDNENYSVETL